MAILSIYFSSTDRKSLYNSQGSYFGFDAIKTQEKLEPSFTTTRQSGFSLDAILYWYEYRTAHLPVCPDLHCNIPGWLEKNDL